MTNRKTKKKNVAQTFVDLVDPQQVIDFVPLEQSPENHDVLKAAQELDLLMKHPQTKPNLIKGAYNCVMTNCVITIDITFFRDDLSALILCDLASRKIIGACVKEHPFVVQDVIDTFQHAIDTRANFPKILILHSDCDVLFAHQLVQDFLNSKGILHSRASSQAFGNQVSERLNQTIKTKIKAKLLEEFDLDKTQHKDVLKQHIYTPLQLDKWFMEVMHAYNATPHSTLNKLSPSQMEDALLFHFKELKGQIVKGNDHKLYYEWKNQLKQHDQSDAVTLEPAPLQQVELLAPSDSEEGEEIKTFLQQAYHGGSGFDQKTAVQWLVNWRNDTTRAHNTLFEQNVRLESSLDALRQHAAKVEQENLSLLKKIEFLYDSEKQKQSEAEEKAIRKAKRRNALEKPRRDVISLQEFQQLLDSISTASPFKRARLIAALIILYYTGLRISNLLQMQKTHFLDLRERGETNFNLIKKGKKDKALILPEAGRMLLRQYGPELLPLHEDKNHLDPLFSSAKGAQLLLSRETLNKEVNSFLKSSKIGAVKNLKSHSFRRSFITDLLRDTPVHNVSKIIGHRSIVSTMQYDAYTLKEEDIKRNFKTLDKRRKESIDSSPA